MRTNQQDISNVPKLAVDRVTDVYPIQNIATCRSLPVKIHNLKCFWNGRGYTVMYIEEHICFNSLLLSVYLIYINANELNQSLVTLANEFPELYFVCKCAFIHSCANETHHID